MTRRTVYYPLSAIILTLIISNFASAQGEKKVAYGILIDNTGSLKTQFTQIRALGKGIVERIHRRGSVSLFNFTTMREKKLMRAVVSSGVEWSQDKDALDDYIDGLFVVPGQTALIDAIDSVAGQINAKANLEKDSFAEKIIILITDGEDRMSKVKEKELIHGLKESGVKVYAVGLVGELSVESGLISRSKKEKAEKFLKRLASETGGRVVFPKSNKVDVDGLLSELLAERGSHHRHQQRAGDGGREFAFVEGRKQL